MIEDILIEKICDFYEEEVISIYNFKYNLNYSFVIMFKTESPIFLSKNKLHILFKNNKYCVDKYLSYLERLNNMKAFW